MDLWVLRDWKPDPHRCWPNKNNTDLTLTILQVGGLIGGSQGISCERKRRGCKSLAMGKRLSFRTAATPNRQLGHAQNKDFLPTSISSSTMCTPTNDLFLKSFSSLEKGFTRLHSPTPQSGKITSVNLARPSSAPPILITPSSTIPAADMAMPITGKITFCLSSTK